MPVAESMRKDDLKKQTETTETTAGKRKKDKILFVFAAMLFFIALALWIAAFVLFRTSGFSPDHSRYFTACLLLACGGISALCSAACLFFSPLVRDKRRRVCPFCGAKISKTGDYCGGCGKRIR